MSQAMNKAEMPDALPYDVMADAVCEIADAAREAFIAAGFDPGEWDGDNIVQDVKRGLVTAIEQLARSGVEAGVRAMKEEAARIFEGCSCKEPCDEYFGYADVRCPKGDASVIRSLPIEPIVSRVLGEK